MPRGGDTLSFAEKWTSSARYALYRSSAPRKERASERASSRLSWAFAQSNFQISGTFQAGKPIAGRAPAKLPKAEAIVAGMQSATRRARHLA
jgi:hypothetical protein